MKPFTTPLKWMALAFVFSMIVSGCSSVSPTVSLGDASCRIPCWYGLAPGKTTFDEALSVVKSLRFVSSDSLKTDSSTPGQEPYIYWLFANELAGQGVVFFDTHKRIQEIRLNTRGLTLGSVIDAFGSPKTIWANITPVVDNFDFGPHYNLGLYFPQGIYIEIADKAKGDLKTVTQDITRDLNVDSIYLFAPTDLETFLGQITESPSNQARLDYIRARLQPWPGFGKDVVHVTWP